MVHHFKEERMPPESDKGPLCSSTSRNDVVVASVHYLMRNDRRLTLHEMDEEVGISCGLC